MSSKVVKSAASVPLLCILALAQVNDDTMRERLAKHAGMFVQYDTSRRAGCASAWPRKKIERRQLLWQLKHFFNELWGLDFRVPPRAAVRRAQNPKNGMLKPVTVNAFVSRRWRRTAHVASEAVGLSASTRIRFGKFTGSNTLPGLLYRLIHRLEDLYH